MKECVITVSYWVKTHSTSSVHSVLDCRNHSTVGFYGRVCSDHTAVPAVVSSIHFLSNRMDHIGNRSSIRPRGGVGVHCENRNHIPVPAVWNTWTDRRSSALSALTSGVFIAFVLSFIVTTGYKNGRYLTQVSSLSYRGDGISNVAWDAMLLYRWSAPCVCSIVSRQSGS